MRRIAGALLWVAVGGALVALAQSEEARAVAERLLHGPPVAAPECAPCACGEGEES